MKAPKASSLPQEELFSNTTNYRVTTCPNNTTLDTLDTTSTHANKDEVTSVFEHWVNTCRPSNKGRRPILDTKRRRKIVAALKHYDTETLKQAIDGVTKSPFHQGDNNRGRTYDELTLILRDAEHIEEFLSYNEPDDIEAWKNE